MVNFKYDIFKDLRYGGSSRPESPSSNQDNMNEPQNRASQQKRIISEKRTN